jgi:hypothetical protein
VIDLLCLDHNGDTVIVELKRDKTPREITAQVLDYASWVKDLSNEKLTGIADRYLQERKGSTLEQAFRERFGLELPEVLNESHGMLIVASQVDNASERIIKYLSDTYGANINAVTFQYFKEDTGEEHIARTFLIQPSQVEYKTQTRTTSKRSPNLSLEELQEAADEKGVEGIYKHLASAVEKYLIKSTTRSSLAFSGNIDGSRNAIFSLIPLESDLENGLRFHVYAKRLMEYFKTDLQAILSILPDNREPWRYYPGADDDLAGYAGYFKNQGDIQRFIDGLQAISRGKNGSA